MGEEKDRILSYKGWRGLAAAWEPVAKRRASRTVRKRVQTVKVRPAGLLSKAGRVVARVC